MAGTIINEIIVNVLDKLDEVLTGIAEDDTIEDEMKIHVAIAEVRKIKIQNYGYSNDSPSVHASTAQTLSRELQEEKPHDTDKLRKSRTS